MESSQSGVGGTPNDPRQPAHSEATEPAVVPGAPVEQTPDPAPTGTDADDTPQMPTPAHEEADKASPDVDDAPDSDEPGDDQLDPDLQEHVSEAPDQPDGVDQEG